MIYYIIVDIIIKILNGINSKIKTGVNYADVKAEVTNTLSSYINLHTGRKPIILPVIMDVKKDVKNLA